MKYRLSGERGRTVVFDRLRHTIRETWESQPLSSGASTLTSNPGVFLVGREQLGGGILPQNPPEFIAVDARGREHPRMGGGDVMSRTFVSASLLWDAHDFLRSAIAAEMFACQASIYGRESTSSWAPDLDSPTEAVPLDRTRTYLFRGVDHLNLVGRRPRRVVILD